MALDSAAQVVTVRWNVQYVVGPDVPVYNPDRLHAELALPFDSERICKAFTHTKRRRSAYSALTFPSRGRPLPAVMASGLGHFMLA